MPKPQCTEVEMTPLKMSAIDFVFLSPTKAKRKYYRYPKQVLEAFKAAPCPLIEFELLAYKLPDITLKLFIQYKESKPTDGKNIEKQIETALIISQFFKQLIQVLANDTDTTTIVLSYLYDAQKLESLMGATPALGDASDPTRVAKQTLKKALRYGTSRS